MASSAELHFSVEVDGSPDLSAESASILSYIAGHGVLSTADSSGDSYNDPNYNVYVVWYDNRPTSANLASAYESLRSTFNSAMSGNTITFHDYELYVGDESGGGDD